MKIFLDTGIFAAYLLEDVRKSIEEEFSGIPTKKDTLYITPLLLEEFSHALLYKIGSDTGIFDQLGGKKSSRSERIAYFFENYGGRTANRTTFCGTCKCAQGGRHTFSG